MRTSNRYIPAAERGLSLIELMIAMVLGLLLIAGVLQVFLGNRQAQRLEQSVSRIEENGRVAMDLITQDLRMSGYYGCSRLVEGERDDPSKPVFKIRAKPATYTAPIYATDFRTYSLRGFVHKMDGSYNPLLASDLSSGATAVDGRKGSDVVAMYYGQPTGMILADDTSTYGTANIVTANTSSVSVSAGDKVLISNCNYTDFLAVTKVSTDASGKSTIEHDTTANVDASLSATSALPYDTLSKLSKFTERVYFVKGTGRYSPDGTEIYSLWRRNGSAAPEEVVEGIEFLHLLYGEQKQTGQIRYVAAGTAGVDWTRIVSVKVALLTKSYDAVRTTADTDTYRLLDQDIAATGTDITHSGAKSLRRVYTATVELRNHGE